MKRKWVIMKDEVGMYICELEWYEPNGDWLLSVSSSYNKKIAIKFPIHKAKLLREILANQVDEEGYSSKYFLEFSTKFNRAWKPKRS
jgi:hypothetical protein